MRANPTCLLSRIAEPLRQRVVDLPAVKSIFDDHEADETAAGVQVAAQGIILRQHAVEDEGYVVILEKMGDSEHAAGSIFRG